MKKQSKNKKKGGFKASLLIQKTEKGYYWDTRENKRVSEQLYKAQWYAGGGRAKKSIFLEAEKIYKTTLEDDYEGDEVSLRYLTGKLKDYSDIQKENKTHFQRLKDLEEATEDLEVGESGFDEKGNVYNKVLYYNLGALAKEYEKNKDLIIQVLEPDSKRLRTVTASEFRQIIIEYIQEQNKANKINRKKGGASNLPIIAVIENIEKNTLIVDLKNTFGADKNEQNFKLLNSLF